jgi:glutamine---fructose-6-phosphate transaminase (isomerizing)
MCGIFAYCSENSKQKEILELIELSKERGQDSYGCTIIKDNYSENFYSDDLLEMKKKVKNKINDGEKSLVIFNSRLVTNGRNPENSQPVITEQISLVHNGIICNFTNLDQHLSIELNFDPSDTVLLGNKISQLVKQKKKEELNQYLNILKGEMSLIIYDNLNNELIYYTNNGSLFKSENSETKILSSEYINFKKPDSYSIIKVALNSLTKLDFNFKNFKILKKKNFSKIKSHLNSIEKISSNLFNDLEKKIENLVSNIKRCTKCVLPETYPYIEFDEKGVCNFCRTFVPKKSLGEDKLLELVEKFYKDKKHKNCLVGLSGGFDSCYTIYAAKKLLKLDPIAYTYDWGLTTDYARINQSIICQKLGVEHIIRTDDLNKKRYDIRQNLIAWLKQPHPGMIPILMAGDKKFLFHEKKLRKKLDIPITLFGTGDQTENRPFYYFLAGAKYEQAKTNIVVMNDTNLQTKLNLGLFYAWNYFKNPRYFNSSFFESLKAYYYSFFHDHRYYGYFDYVDFKEENINNLISDFDLETDKKYGKVLWRMGDGQSSFNNLLYATLCGFSEIDDYESNKVRLNRISREDALKSVIDHNLPKKNNLEYFFSLVKIDPDMVFKKILNLNLKKWV